MLLKDIMNEQIVFLNLGDTLEKVVRIFRQYKIASIPVVDSNEQLLSVFTRPNLYDALLKGASLTEPIDPYVNDRLVSLKEDMPFDELAEFAKDTPIGTFPVTQRDGKVVGVLTKANMVVTLIRKSEILNTQLKAILDSMYNGVIVVNNKGQITLINSGAERLFKKTEESCLGLPLNDMLPDLDLEPALVEGQIKVGLKLKHDAITTIANITPLINDSTIVGAIAIFQDLTDLEQVARELESVTALNKTLDTVLNIIYDGIIVIDENGLVALSNRALNDFLKMPPRKIIGKHITEIMTESRLHIVAKTGIPEICDIQTIVGKPLIVSSLPITKAGKTVGAVGKVTFPQSPEIKELADKLAFLQNKISYYQEQLEKTKTAGTILDAIVEESSSMKKIKDEIIQIAKSTSTVLITGESGTGKELVAQAIHMCSDRNKGAFVKVNCGAIPENLLEAEMFGYAPGAFTGALKNGKQGRFELANGGTILLDEVGDMPFSLQVKILRVIQEREFERLGDTKTRKIDVRILAATNKDLKIAIVKGTFREDLYYRLNVIGLHLPPLREHIEDIKPLVNKFIDKYNRILNANTSGITANALEVLSQHSWPGNVRELENIIERAVNYARSGSIEDVHFPPYLTISLDQVPHQVNSEKGSYRDGLVRAEKEMIIAAIDKVGGNKTKAAELLNLSRSRLYVKMKKYGIT
ncbi:MAG: sigma 54-interacting transcriptional regulator [Desulfitobacteriaceae bacterium]